MTVPDRRTRILTMSCHLATLPKLVLSTVIFGSSASFLISTMHFREGYGAAYVPIGVGFYWIYLSVFLILLEEIGISLPVRYCRKVSFHGHSFIAKQAMISSHFRQITRTYFYTALCVCTFLLFSTCAQSGSGISLSEGKELLYMTAFVVHFALIGFYVLQTVATLSAASQAWAGQSYRYPLSRD
jgi:uncharacterized Tic20 family protein